MGFPIFPDFRPKPLRSRGALYDGWSECQGKRPRRTALWMVTRCRKTVSFCHDLLLFCHSNSKKKPSVFNENVQYLRIGSFWAAMLWGHEIHGESFLMDASAHSKGPPGCPDGWKFWIFWVFLWWFGTWIFWLSIIWNDNPNWRTHIFQKGRYTTKQKYVSNVRSSRYSWYQ